jgi:hypothetical protein
MYAFFKTGSYCRKCVLSENKKIVNTEYKTKYGFETLKKEIKYIVFNKAYIYNYQQLSACFHLVYLL